MQENRSLNFNAFLQQRAKQISNFTSTLQAVTSKRGHYALPKSIRRRAMSHNRYRVPFKVRKRFDKQLKQNQAMQKLPKSRKHIRKRSRLISSYKDRFGKIRWLSTHLWAAKRMRIVEKYGYKIAETPNDKCFRSAYRQYRHNCCLMDFSYLEDMMICSEGNMVSAIKQFGVNIDNYDSTVSENQSLNFGQYYRGYVENSEGVLICPLLILKEGATKIHCFYHPAASAQLQTLMQNTDKLKKSQVEITFTRGQTQIYLLLGPKSIEIVKNVLDIEKYNLQSFGVLNPFYFRKNQLICVERPNQSLKSQQKKRIITNPYDQIIKQKYQKSQYDKIRQQILAQYSNMIQESKVKDEDKNQSFWREYDQQVAFKDQFTFSFTTRSKYTHRRTNKVSKQDKKKTKTKGKETEPEKIIPEQLQKLSILNQAKKQEPPLLKPNQKIQITIKKNFQAQNQKNRNSVLIGIINEENFYQGCYFFCSKSQNCKLWRLLTNQHVKVIGREQYRHFMLQSNIKVFPQDYPTTNSFKQYNQMRTQKQLKKVRNRPPQKRINFAKIRSPFPFSLNPEKLPDFFKQCPLKMIRIEMVGKGRCFEGSYILQATKADLQKAYSQIQKKGKVSIVDSEEVVKQSEPFKLDYKKLGKAQIIEKLASIQGKSRKIIGFATSGGILMSKCQQGGIGYITAAQIQEYVLIRKVSSRHYYLARVKQVSPLNCY